MGGSARPFSASTASTAPGAPRRGRTRSVAELFGQPPQPRTGRDRIIAAAIELFYSRGFQAVGLDQVIAAAGVTKTTFYKHFDGKDDLVLAAVERRDRWEAQAWQRAARQLAGDDVPAAQLLAYFDVLDAWFNDPDFHGCMFINTAVEFPDPRDPIHRAAAAHKRQARDQFRDLARAAGARDPEAFADVYTGLLEGAIVLRHTHGRDDAARALRPAVAALLREHCPEAQPRGRQT